MASENVSRSRQFKNVGKGTEDGRRKRNDASVELRKIKKDDQMMKRRNLADVDIDEPTSPLQERSNNVPKSPVTPLPMYEIVTSIIGKDADKHLIGVQSARKILSRERNPPIDDFIKSGVVPHLVTFLDRHDNTTLQFEAAWALTNIASGNAEQTITVVKAGAIPKFAALLKSTDENVREQCVWALGNIAGDGPHLRDQVIEAGAVPSLMALVKLDTKVAVLRNLAWTLSNLCRNKNPPPPFESCCSCLPVFAKLLCHQDVEVLGDTCWALSYISDGPNEKIEAVLNSGVLPRLVELLYHEESQVVTPALRAVGNIVTGDDRQTQTVIDTPGAMQAFALLLTHSKSSIKKESAWAISNITAGNQDQIQASIDANVIPGVLSLMEHGDFKGQKEAVWVITNLTSGGSPQQIAYVVNQGCLGPLIQVMAAKDPKTVLVVLDSISNILQAASRSGDEGKEWVCTMFEELWGVDKLEALQEHENTEIYQVARRLIEKYFSGDGDDDDETLAPGQQTDQFEFSQPTSEANGQTPPSNFNF